MRFTILVVFAFLVAGCNNGDRTDSIKEAAALKVKSSLRDPDSAKITVSEVFTLFDGKIACGTVNARNGFGGYTGDMNFSVTINPDGSIGDADIADDEKLSLLRAESCKFLHAYGQRPGHSGAEATPAQAAALKAEYQKWVTATAVEIVNQSR